MTLTEAGILGGTYIVYLICVAKWSTWLKYSMPAVQIDHETESNLVKWCHKHAIKAFCSGILLIGLLSHFMVESAIHVANGLGIPFAIIALTILAAGTSIPDLLSSIIVAKKGQ